MMIGKFTQQGEGYTGWINCFRICLETVTFSPMPLKQGSGPDFVILARDLEEYEFGAAWKKTSKASKPYLSAKLDSPTLPAPINCALIRQPDGSFGLVWNRKEREGEAAATEATA